MLVFLIVTGCSRPYGDAPEEESVAGSTERPAAKMTMSADAGRTGAPAPQPPPTDAGTGALTTRTPTPPAPSDVVYTGATGKLVGEFGGEPYCAYAVVFDDVRVSVTVDPAGKVKAAELTATVSETTTPDCPHATIPEHDHTYLYAPAQSAGGDLKLLALSTNRPRAEVTMTRQVIDGAILASFTIRRVDQTAPLDWKVEAEVTLTP